MNSIRLLILCFFVFRTFLTSAVNPPVIACPLNNSFTGVFPTISGTSAAYDSIHIYLDNNFESIVVCNATGDFTFTPSTAIGPGMHTVKALAEDNGSISLFCPDDTFYVSLDGPAGFISGPVAVCTGDIAQLQDSAPGGTWSSSNGSIATVDAMGMVTGITSGSVNITYSIMNSCVTASASASLEIKPIPSVNPLSDQSYCNGTFTGAMNFSGPVAGTIYSWSNDNPSTGIASSGFGNIPGFLAINTGLTAQSSELIVMPTANGCMGSSDTVTITVLPTPALISTLTPAPICSNTEFQYTPLSSLPGTNFLWNRPLQAAISPSPMNDSGQISEVLINTGTTPVTITYNYRLEASGCIAVTPVLLLVNPAPVEAPQISLFPTHNLCSGTRYQNFGALNPPAIGQHYIWSTVNAEVWAVGSQQQNVLINFSNPGPAWVYLSSSYPGINCVLKDSVSLQVNADQSETPSVNYYSGQFICEDNTLDSYQWGYDDAYTLYPYEFPNAINQNYAHPAPDFSNHYYWVKTVKNGCHQKSYNNEPQPTGFSVPNDPTALHVFPNPSTGTLNIQYTSTGTNKNTEMEITDLAGRTLYKTSLDFSGASLDLSEIPSGFYVIHVARYNHPGQIIKWIKQ